MPRHHRQPDPIAVRRCCDGFLQAVNILKDRRKCKKWSVPRLAKRAGVQEQAIESLEAYELSISLDTLMAIAAALDRHLKLDLLPTPVPLPNSSAEILAEYDRLLKRKGKFFPFRRNVADTQHKALRWDVVGDLDRNWLYVVADNHRRKVRFGAVTDAPGGWSIADQLFGMDAETQAIADEMAYRLFREHHAQLVK